MQSFSNFKKRNKCSDNNNIDAAFHFGFKPCSISVLLHRLTSTFYLDQSSEEGLGRSELYRLYSSHVPRSYNKVTQTHFSKLVKQV